MRSRRRRNGGRALLNSTRTRPQVAPGTGKHRAKSDAPGRAAGTRLSDELVTSALQLTEPMARGKGLRLRADVPWHMPLVRADPARIGHVLNNLFSNATKLTDAGGSIDSARGRAAI